MPRVLALILAGGRVNELGVLTHLRPKATMPFGGLYRIIDFPLSNLMNSGIDRVGVLCQYRASSIVEHIGNGHSWDMVGRDRGVTLLPPFQGLSASDWYKGTADAVYQNIDFIESVRPDLVLILSGDHVYRMDYQELIGFHLDSGADCTCAFVYQQGRRTGPSRFGEARIEQGDDQRGGKVLGYREKPSEPYSEWASMTIYLFEKNVLLDALHENASRDSHEFGRDIFPALLEHGCNVHGFYFKGYWAYARTLEEFWKANMDLLGDTPRIDIEKWNIRTNLEHESISDRGPALFGKDAVIEDSRFYNGVRIEGVVRRSILFPGVVVGKDAIVEDSILFFDTQIAPGATVFNTISDICVTVGRDARVGRPGGAITALGAGISVPSGIFIEEGTHLEPAQGMRS